MKRIFLSLLLMIWATATYAACPSLPYTFVNGTTADAGQVNSNLLALWSCINAIGTGSSAANGTVYSNFSGVAGGLQANPLPTGMKNRLINGAMNVDQRLAGGLQSVVITDTFLLDRWLAHFSAFASLRYQQNQGSLTPPAGFANYLGALVYGPGTPGASDYYGVEQRIEGNNTWDLGFGTANASSLGLSFWVQSSIAGLYGGSICNGSGGAATRCYVFSYAISAPNAWQKINLVIPGDLTGTWAGQVNTTSMILHFSLGAGTNFESSGGSWQTVTNQLSGVTGEVNLVKTNNATWDVTGVQLEANVTSPFEFRPFAVELALCQRYYETNYDYGTAVQSYPITDYPENFLAPLANSIWQMSQFVPFTMTKRAAPTVTLISPATGVINMVRDLVSSADVAGVVNLQGPHGFTVSASLNASHTQMSFGWMWTASSEL